MQNSTELYLSGNTVDAIRSRFRNRKQILIEDLNDHHEDISFMIGQYHWEDRGEVDNLNFEDLILNNNGSGKVCVKYDVHIYNGCSDLDKHLDDSIELTFKVDFETKYMKISGPIIPDREPDIY